MRNKGEFHREANKIWIELFDFNSRIRDLKIPFFSNAIQSYRLLLLPTRRRAVDNHDHMNIMCHLSSMHTISATFCYMFIPMMHLILLNMCCIVILVSQIKNWKKLEKH